MYVYNHWIAYKSLYVSVEDIYINMYMDIDLLWVQSNTVPDSNLHVFSFNVYAEISNYSSRDQQEVYHNLTVPGLEKLLGLYVYIKYIVSINTYIHIIYIYVYISASVLPSLPLTVLRALGSTMLLVAGSFRFSAIFLSGCWSLRFTRVVCGLM